MHSLLTVYHADMAVSRDRAVAPGRRLLAVPFHAVVRRPEGIHGPLTTAAIQHSAPHRYQHAANAHQAVAAPHPAAIVQHALPASLTLCGVCFHAILCEAASLGAEQQLQSADDSMFSHALTTCKIPQHLHALQTCIHSEYQALPMT